MDKNTINSNIQKAIDALGPSIVEVKLDLGAGPQDFIFRRLPFLEMDRLRLHAINAEGKFDKTLHLGSNARLVSASLCDDTGTPFATAEDISNWPTPIVDRLAAEAQKVNGLTPEAKEEVGKKSVKTDSVV